MFIVDAYDNLTNNNKKHTMYTQIAIDKKPQTKVNGGYLFFVR